MATNTEKIDTILTIVQEIRSQNAVQALQIQNVQECVDEHDEAINGNGKPGLKADVEATKNNLKIVNWLGALIAAAIIMDMVTRGIALLH
jgi:hypothetical protein